MIQEELAQTTIPEYAHRTENDIKEAFEIYGDALGLKLLDISKTSVKLYEDSKYLFKYLKAEFLR
jgi:hypothetical protein